MKEETLIKYLEFLKNECSRYQNDKIIADDEIKQLQIEVTRFLEKVKESAFSDNVKLEISKIDFNLDEENHNHSKFNLFKFIGGSQGKEFREQENRKQRFSKLFNDLDASIFKLKTIL